MEALLCKRLGDPASSSSLSPIKVSRNHTIPELDSPTAVRVKVKATSLNYANYLQILGKYQEKPPLPFIPGSDYAGTVDAVGPDVTKFKNWTVHGLYWGSCKIHRPAVLEDSIRELLSWMEKGLITLHISHTYSLSEANLAFSAIKDRKAIGKVMIAFDDLGGVRSKL